MAGLLVVTSGLTALPQPLAAPSLVTAAWLLTAVGAALSVAFGLGRGGIHVAVAVAVVAGLAATLAAAALPEHPRWGEPLRHSLNGIGPLVWLTLAGAGLVASGWQSSTLARGLAGLGSAGLWLHGWMPVGFAGETRIPALAALGTVPAAAAADQAPIQAVIAGGHWLALLGALSSAVLVGLVMRPAWPRLWSAAALAGLALAVVGGASESGPAVALLQLGAAGVGAAAIGGHLGQAGGQSADPQSARPLDFAALGRAVEPWAVGLVLLAYALLKVNGLRYSTTDEALYFYAAKIWADGSVPYRDFFFSHPPLHIAVPALLYKVFGYHFIIGKLLSAGAAAGAGLFNWAIARHFLGPWGGALALVLHLTAGEVLQASTNLTGVNLTACWLMAGLWLLWVARRYGWAGACLGAAASTGFYAFGGYVAAAVLCLLLPWPARWSDGRAWLRHPLISLTIGFVAIWGGVNLLFWAIGGDGYLDGVYSYHLAKKAKVEGFAPISGGPMAIASNFALMLSARDFAVSVYHHAAHWWLALGLPLALLMRAWADSAAQVTVALRAQVVGAPARSGPLATGARSQAPGAVLVAQALGAASDAQTRVAARPWTQVLDPRQWWVGTSTGIALVWALLVALLIEFGQFKERYDFYFALVLPLVATCAAGFICELAHMGFRLLSFELHRHSKVAPCVGFAVLAVFGLCWMPIDMAANRAAYPSEFTGAKMEGHGPGERLEFEWLPAPGPPWLSQWTQALVWKSYRIRGSVESGVHHYLWGKKRWFSKAQEMAAHIAANTTADETITGASDYAPLLALLANRRMAGNHVDTNSKVFNTGAVALEKFWDDGCRDKLKFIVVAPQSYFAAQDLPKRTSVVDNFVRDKGYSDPALKHWRPLEMELWRRKGPELCSFRGQRGIGPVLGK